MTTSNPAPEPTEAGTPMEPGMEGTPGPAAPGRFVWHDLNTPDPEAARAFYTGLFGWGYHEMPDEALSGYPMIQVGEQMIGGIVRLGPDREGIPPHWMAYVSVEDVDATAQAAAESGGQVRVPGTDIPNVGRFAVIADPSGASLSLWRSASGEDVEPEQPVDGTFVWNELLTTDPAGCGAFYTKILPWKQESVVMPGGDPSGGDASGGDPSGGDGSGGEMTYHLFKRANQKDGSGMMEMPPGAEAPPHWLPYVGVSDVDATAAKAVELGATQYVEPQDIPNIGRFAVFADPQGAVFAIYNGAPSAAAGS